MKKISEKMLNMIGLTTKKKLEAAFAEVEKMEANIERIARVREKYDSKEYTVDKIERITVYDPETLDLQYIKAEMERKILEGVKNDIEWNVEECRQGKAIKATLKVLRR